MIKSTTHSITPASYLFLLRHTLTHPPLLQVFIEAMIDPLKTVNKDVLPRFLVSGFYQDFQMRMASVKLLPPAKDLVVHAPSSAPCLNLDMDVTTLEEIKKVPWRCDRVLYEAFKDYLTSIVAVELLLCVRKIANYQQLWTEARTNGTLENHPCAFGTLSYHKLLVVLYLPFEISYPHNIFIIPCTQPTLFISGRRG